MKWRVQLVLPVARERGREQSMSCLECAWRLTMSLQRSMNEWGLLQGMLQGMPSHPCTQA